MKILIVEDNKTKIDEISKLAYEIDQTIVIDVATSIAEMVSYCGKNKYELITLDFRLPLAQKGKVTDAGQELLKIVKNSTLNTSADLVAVTEFSELADNLSQEFAKVGVVVCLYSDVDQAWRTTVDSLIRKSVEKATRKFVVVCALSEEREGFLQTNATINEATSIQGLDVWEISIGDISGVIVLCPRMGLVNASIITTIAIERFSPEILCMSGICAGFIKNSEIGQVIVANPVFEYQVGKYTKLGFEVEPYQQVLAESLRQELSIITTDEGIVDLIYEGIDPEFLPPQKPIICPFGSGSAVVADSNKSKQIATQHRKISGLDMEACGVMQAASLCNESVKVFTAKAVVDFADAEKDDDYHEVGSIISARFCVKAISEIMSQK